MLTKWQAIHKHKKLVQQGTAMPIRCPNEEAIYITRIGQDEEPVLYCYMCKTTVIPGLWLYKQLEAAINEKIDTIP